MASPRSILSACLLLQAASAAEFTFLTYNIAGLPLVDNGVPGSKPDNMETIGSKFAEYGYDVIQVQEDFNYHDHLYSTDNHPNRTETSGGVLVGDGLNTLANFGFDGLSRTKWEECSSIDAADCFTPKGFSAMTMELDTGVFVDFYNIHADAGTSDADFEARRDNIAQMAEFVETNSANKAVVIGGDTNMLYTRESETVEILTDIGMIDTWVELVLNGTAPSTGAAAPAECGNPAENVTCETLDKVFYRSGSDVDLKATRFNYETSKFLQEDGSILSDHNPVTVSFSFTAA
ncbi:hypothetical protein FQN54_002583 [Arachnomyces sp. PD_36]|nr:hypothetical protein FQN54_002583 [Arachnomyces sp. PD_36]